MQTDWSKFDFSDENINTFLSDNGGEETKPIDHQTDWSKFDFSDEGINRFLSTKMPEPEPGFIDKASDILDAAHEINVGVSEATPGVIGATLGSIALAPGAGIRAAIELIPTMSTDPDEPWWKGEVGSLSKAGEVFEEIMSVPGKLITTEEQAKAVENIGYVMKPIEMSGEGWRLIGEKVNSGLKHLGFADTYIEPLFATYGEAAAILAIPGVIKRLSKTPVKQRGLKVQDLLDEVKDNPNMSEAEILRKAGPKSKLWEEKLTELRKTEVPKARPIKTEPPKGSVPKSPRKTRPVDKKPDYAFESKKGNRYELVDDVWYDKNGKQVTNKFIIAAAEKGKYRFVDVKEAKEPIVEEPTVEIKVKGKEEVPGTPEEIRKVEEPKVRKKIKPTEEPDIHELEHMQGLLNAIEGVGDPMQGLVTMYGPDRGSRLHKAIHDILDEEGRFPRGDRAKEVFERADRLRVKPTKPKTEQIEEPPISEIEEGDVKTAKGNLFRTEKSCANALKRKKIKDHEPVKVEGGYVGRLVEEPVIESGDPYKDTLRGDQLSVKELKEMGLSDETAEALAGYTEAQIENILRDKDALEGEGEPVAQPVAGGPARSAFRELDPEITKQRVQNYPDYRKIDNPDTLAGKLKSELNLGLDDPSFNAEPAKQLTSMLADQLEKWAADEEPPGGVFEDMTLAELEQTARVFREMDKWAKSEEVGKKIKRTEPSVELYSIGGAVIKGVRQLFNKLTFRKSKLQPTPPEPYVRELARETVRTRRSTLDLSNYETNLFLNGLENKTTSLQREALTFMREKTDVPSEFERPDIAKTLKDDKEYLKPIDREIQEWFDKSWVDLKKYLPDLTVKQIENYVTHLWDIPKHKRAEAVNWFSTHSGFLERRFIPTYADGIKRGYKPKTVDIAEIIKVHDNAINRVKANVQYVSALLRLKADGINLIQRSTKAPLDYVEVDYPMLTRRIPLPPGKVKNRKEFVKESRVRVHPDLVRPLKVVFEERFDHPIVSAYEAINGVMKKSMLSLALFHHGALGETGTAIMGLKRTGKIYFDPVKVYKALVRNEFEVFNRVPVAKDSIIHGVQYGATADYPLANIQKWLDNLAKKTEKLPIGNRVTRFVNGFNSTWDKALWNYLHDTLKLYAYEALTAKMDPKLGVEDMTRAKREIAQFVNDTFGGQQWENLMITPKEVQMMTWSLLSADWTFSTMRQALSPTGIGKVHRSTSGMRKKLGWKFWGRAALYFGVGINALNALFREWDMRENPQFYEDEDEWDYFDKTMFGNSPGKKTYLFAGRYEDGSERYIRWGKQFREMFEMFANPLKKAGGKVSPIPQTMSEILTGHTLSGFKNDDVYRKKGLEKALGTAKTVAKAFIPLSVRKAMQEDSEFKLSDIMMQSSKGMTRYSAIEYFKEGIVEEDKEERVRMIEETYMAALRNGLPAFTLFNDALRWLGAEEAAELRETVDDIEDVEAKMLVTDIPKEKIRLGRILRRLKMEKADLEQGSKLLDTVLEKLKGYDVMSEPQYPRLGVVGGRIRAPQL